MSTLDDIQRALDAIRKCKELRDRIALSIKGQDDTVEIAITVTMFEAAMICASLDQITKALDE